MTDYWQDDLLDFREIGRTFTNLVSTIDSEKVISIEAGFGRGKTFFRNAWASQLREAGEVVVEVDVLQSDHSGDPVITLIGALVEALPRTDKKRADKALSSAKKLTALGAKSVTKAILRSGADELIDAVTDSAIDALDDFDALDDLIEGVGAEMSKAAGQLIASQMANEKVRKVELPLQLETLKRALIEDSQVDRIVIIIDELDRCHPDYAIAFLEAMKVVFSQSGFVFFLMADSEYLERIARSRFGEPCGDEKYLEKFIDIRLKLEPKREAFENAVLLLANTLPLAIPFAENEHFSKEAGAKLASDLAVAAGLSMRKVKRILLKVELALRCYSDRPLDLPLLIFLAFQDEAEDRITADFLKRATFTPEMARRHLESIQKSGSASVSQQRDQDYRRNQLIYEGAPELLDLPRERYRLPDDRNYKDWALVFQFLAEYYIPEHRDVLDAVAEVIVSEE